MAAASSSRPTCNRPQDGREHETGWAHVQAAARAWPEQRDRLLRLLPKGPRRIVLAVGVLLAVTLVVAAVVYSGLWSTGPAGEAHTACHDAITGQLDPEAIQFVDETTDESTAASGGTNVIVRGTAETGWSDHHAYTCTYSDGKLVEANLD